MSPKKKEGLPDPKDVEKEISDFLTQRFGGRVKLISPVVVPEEASLAEEPKAPSRKKIDFSLKPEELEAYLDQYIVKQDEAKAILATKICTHFNRIKHAEASGQKDRPMVGNIKNNILMIGPTGVGKTYMIKLIAQKIGVPFVKGDATKFSETGYVGGDVEDLVRDLVREADDDIELAQCGIIYIDEIDKIASSSQLIGPDVSRTGVQRALLKPMEETEVDLKVPHDPISMLEEIERYRKTGKRNRRIVNTRNILFVMSGAFGNLTDIIRKRMAKQGIGFGASVKSRTDGTEYLKYVKPEDLAEFGFESEFIGRLPVTAVFEKLEEPDLLAILKNPNNPVVLSKKIDFKAYGIDVKFDDQALAALARRAYSEGTGARGLVSVVEKALLKFEKRLPSTEIKKLAVTEEVMKQPQETLDAIVSATDRSRWETEYDQLLAREKAAIAAYLEANKAMLYERHAIRLTPSRVALASEIYAFGTEDVNAVMEKIKACHDQVRKMEAYFGKTHDLQVTLDEDAVDLVISRMNADPSSLGDFYRELTTNFEYGFKLIRDRTGQKVFVLGKEALQNPEGFLNGLIKETYAADRPTSIVERG